nr:hypothetical protein Iba_chr09aCG5900 [Ipomoea batatas]GME12168.1 hypothetical protein Iba_scaffold13479CG0010 [Ipomoea batatas]
MSAASESLYYARKRERAVRFEIYMEVSASAFLVVFTLRFTTVGGRERQNLVAPTVAAGSTASPRKREQPAGKLRRVATREELHYRRGVTGVVVYPLCCAAEREILEVVVAGRRELAAARGGGTPQSPLPALPHVLPSVVPLPGHYRERRKLVVGEERCRGACCFVDLLFFEKEGRERGTR